MNRSSQGASSSSSNLNTELLCRVKYLNNLPDIPFDPKFISYPFDPSRFIQYNSTSLEKNYKWDILNEQDLGVRIDLINPDTYKSEPNAILDEADEKLLEEETITAADAKRSEQHNKAVPWLRRNEYISTENTRFQPKAYDQAESKVGYSIKRKLSQLDFYKDKESQIIAIEKSFEAAKTPVEKHFGKQGVFPVQEMPIFPDFELWRYSCAQVIFDDDPTPKGRQTEEMSQAIIRGMIDDTGDEFVAYFLPTDETVAKRKCNELSNSENNNEDEFDYKLIREYTWNMKTKTNSGYEENYYFILKENGVFYNQLETRVRLNKRRSKSGKVSNSRLVVKYRDLNNQELKQQRNRVKELQAVHEDDEDENEEDEEVETEEVEETSKENATKQKQGTDNDDDDEDDADFNETKKDDDEDEEEEEEEEEEENDDADANESSNDQNSD